MHRISTRLSSLLIILTLFLSAFPAQASTRHPVRPDLTCYYTWNTLPPVTHRLVLAGDPASLDIGISSAFGGIAVELWLDPDQLDDSPAVNVLEAKSGSGSGWQFTGHTTTYDGYQLITNQAAGNHRGYQWGYSTTYTSNKLNALSGTNWAHNDIDSFDHIGTSPCELFNATNNPVMAFDEGQLNLSAARRWTPTGFALSVRNAYSLHSLVDQYWYKYLPTQALYLSRSVARQQQLRLFLVGQDWVEGPLVPYQAGLTVQHSILDIDSEGNISWLISEEVTYAVFIWQIYGQDIGMAIPMTNGANLSLEQYVYCDNPADDTCGSIRWITNAETSLNASFPNGSTRTYAFEYQIGTLTQLEFLGFHLP